MAIDLTKRAEKGLPITETEHDTNLTDIETAVNSLLTTIADHETRIAALEGA